MTNSSTIVEYKYCNDWKEYAEKALVTIKKFPEGDERTIAHPFIGLMYECAEVGDVFKKHIIYEQELDKVALKKELGDCFWYVAAMLALSENGGLDIEEIESSSGTVVIDNPNELYITMPMSLCHHAAQLPLFYTTQKVVELNESLSNVVHILTVICSNHGFSILDVLNTNLEKLAARYPDQIFTTEASKIRADETPLH